MNVFVANRHRAWILALAIFLSLAILLQWASGAFHSELASYADEPAHYVTSLMIHDWITHGFPMPPMPFAENYYLHYPKVALGEWPPLFHIIQAIWTLVFTPARGSVMVFTALLTALVALTLYRTMLNTFGSVFAGLVAGVVFVALPAVQRLTFADMADMLVGLLDLWAILAFIRYLERERTQDALWFGVWSGLCMMTKQNGAALIVIAIVTLALSRRWHLLLKAPLWKAAGIAILLAGPWEYMVWRIDQRNLLIQTRSPGFGTIVLLDYCRRLPPMASAAVLITGAIGIWARVVSKWGARQIEPRWAAWVALPLGVLLFHSFLPGAIHEPRYWIAALPGILMLAAAGVKWLADKLPSDRLPWQNVFRVGAIGTILCAAQVFGIVVKPSYSIRQAAADLLRTSTPQDVYLVSSEDGAREGAFVAEVAMHEVRPGHIVLRAGKLLTISNWMTDHYMLVYSTPEQVQAYLTSLPISVVVLDGRTDVAPLHHKLLRQVLQQFPDTWKLNASYPNKAPGDVTEVYQRIGPKPPATGTIRLNMQYTLGRTLEH